MRLPTDVRTRFFALGLTALLAACGRGGSEFTDLAAVGDGAEGMSSYGPAGDYPVVLGDPYSIDGTSYTPADKLNHDEVGFAAADTDGGSAISVAHKTLPLPSYVEVTALDTGKTILARVERRGPMNNDQLLALSPGAMTQLAISDGAAIRVRRVNPPEVDRAKLRMGEAAPLRMDTPKSLLSALTRKLPARGSVSLSTSATVLAAAENVPPAAPQVVKSDVPQAAPTSVAKVAKAVAPAASVNAPKKRNDQAFSAERKAVTAYPLAPIGGAAAGTQAATRPPATTAAAKVAATPKNPAPVPATAPPTSSTSDGFVIQAAAFSSKASADRAAHSIGGFVQQSGKYFRVRKGPFANRGQAEAALAKVRAAGYSDARMFTAG